MGDDLLLSNGRIFTPAGKDGWAQAMAVQDGVIVAIGRDEEVRLSTSAATRQIDLGGRSVFPGLHDSHVHPLFAGLEHNGCAFPPGSTPEVITATVAECASRTAPGEWILGGNWIAAVFDEGEQNHALLDAAAPDNPVALINESHHTVWVNAAAMQQAGITADTPDPTGGVIDRDGAGEPTGILRESAQGLVDAVIPPPTLEVRRQALEWASAHMLSYGITSYTIASVREPDLLPLSQLSAEGLIKQRVRGCIVWPGDELNPRSEQLIEARHQFETSRLKLDCVKMFLDGVPTESHTGAMVAPYEGSTELGMLMIPQGALERGVARYDRQGLHIKFHAAGDGAVRAGIDAVEAARTSNGYGGQSHHIGHSTFVHPDDIPRAVPAHLAWGFSPYIWYPTPMAAVDVANAVGKQRMLRWLPIREAIDTGALVMVGSDWSIPGSGHARRFLHRRGQPLRRAHHPPAPHPGAEYLHRRRTGI